MGETLREDLEPTFRGTLPGRKGVQLAFARWEHPVPKGRMVLLHGYGEHGERYRHTAKWFHDLGWSVSTLDQQGFGRSGGVRGDAHGIRGFVEDLVNFLRQERLHDIRRAGIAPEWVEGMPTLPAAAGYQLLLGHSFGGLVALLAVLYHPDAADGLILSSPAVSLRPFSRKERVGMAVLSCFAPHWSLAQPSGKDRVCSDPTLVEAFHQDPFCHQHITASFVKAMRQGQRELLAYGNTLDRPLLLLESTEDVLCDPDAATPLWAKLRPEFLEHHRLEGLKHELLHDLRRQEVHALIEGWLEEKFRT